MAIHTVRLGKNKYVTLDSYSRPPLTAPIIVGVITCLALIGAGTYALNYESPVCPKGLEKYYGPAC